MTSHISDPRNQRFLQASGGKLAQKKDNRLKKFKIDALPDVPDIRDRMYEPALVPLAREMKAPSGLHIMNQGKDGACTGFALAAVINRLHAAQRDSKIRVSPFMLYEMARRHDEWPGERYSGSSLRGALRGWFNNGVCLWDSWNNPNDTTLTLERAKEARSYAVGAYYRLRQQLSDFHAALTEAGVVYVSAAVHDGWMKVDPRTGMIPPAEGTAGLHAFAIVGYDLQGFWIQNSWGKEWGRGGLAKWCYEDWAANLEDAWVLRLALPTPAVFGLTGKTGSGNAAEFWSKSPPKPTRSDIAGHFVHIDDGDFSPKQ
ncbi:MAG TPA: C1 family peptidase, partial [Dongiaceae bacterium]